jgi:hypothetical protein
LCLAIIFLQLFEAVADNFSAYTDAGGGWSQPYRWNQTTTPLVDSVIGNLPTLTDALSKFRISLCRQINTIWLTAGFSVQLFFTRRIFKFSKLYFGIKIRAVMFMVCIFIFLVSSLPFQINSDSNLVTLKTSLLELATGLATTDVVSFFYSFQCDVTKPISSIGCPKCYSQLVSY